MFFWASVKFPSCEGYTVHACFFILSSVLSHRWDFPFLIGIYSPLPIHTQACFYKCYLSDRNIFSFLSPCIITCTSHQSPKWCPLGSIISLLQPGRRWTALEPCYAFLMKLLFSWKNVARRKLCIEWKAKEENSFYQNSLVSFFFTSCKI